VGIEISVQNQKVQTESVEKGEDGTVGIRAMLLSIAEMLEENWREMLT
jgi:hypothetical protein